MSAALRAQRIRSLVADAAARAGRDPGDVTLIAVSKTHPAAAIDEVAATGIVDFGESRVQEWRAKRAEVRAQVRWHFIGRLQTNKVREVAGHVHLVHVVDRPSLVAELDRRAEARQQVLVQVDVAGEAAKGGCRPEETAALLDAIAATDHLAAVGLMAIPPAVDDAADARPWFRALRELRDGLRETLASRGDDARAQALRHLSMGMSHDFEIAIEEGATLVRVGTAIFGAREAAA